MKSAIKLTLTLFALGALSWAALAQQTIEPGQTVEGSLADSTDSYTLTLEQDQPTLISLSSPDFDTYIEVQTSTGELVVGDDDSGPGTDSQVLLVPAGSGTFTVVVRGFGGTATGDYTLSVGVGELQILTVGEPAVVEVSGAVSEMFSFEGEGGAVYTITAESDGQVDTSLRLLDSSGSQIDFSEDFTGNDPQLRRLSLPASGTYYVILAPYSELDVGSVTVMIEETEALTLSSEPLVITFGPDLDEDVASFEVEAGTLYQILVTTSAVTSGSVSLTSSDMFTFIHLSFSNAEGGSLFYRADFTGMLEASISHDDFFSDASVDFTVTVTTVDE